MSHSPDRNQFLNFAGVVEGGLALIALAVGWLVSIDPVAHLAWDWRGFIWGSVAALPTFGLFLLTYRLPFGPLRKIRTFLSRELAPSLASLRWFDLILLAILAGVSEELLFRGLLQSWIGILWANILFGLVHWITPWYAVLAFGIGCYLSWLMSVTEPHSLLTPMVTHALHDYLAFLVIVDIYRRETTPQPVDSDTDA
jgi:membrane protease YdiL (CAAX protease family)